MIHTNTFQVGNMRKHGYGMEFPLGPRVSFLSPNPNFNNSGGEKLSNWPKISVYGATSPYTISVPQGHMEDVWADWFLSFQVSTGGKKIPCLRKRTPLTPYPRARYGPKIHPRLPLLSQLSCPFSLYRTHKDRKHTHPLTLKQKLLKSTLYLWPKFPTIKASCFTINSLWARRRGE